MVLVGAQPVVGTATAAKAIPYTGPSHLLDLACPLTSPDLVPRKSDNAGSAISATDQARTASSSPGPPPGCAAAWRRRRPPTHGKREQQGEADREQCVAEPVIDSPSDGQPGRDQHDDAESRPHDQAGGQVEPPAHPARPGTRGERFEFGLDCVLEGIATMLAKGPPRA